MKFESPRMTNANIGKSGVCFILHMHGVRYEAERCGLYIQIQADCGCTRCNAPSHFCAERAEYIDVQKIWTLNLARAQSRQCFSGVEYRFS